MTNRKPHTHFRSGTKSTTLDDLEGSLVMHSVSKHMRLSEPTTKIWMKIDLYYQRRRCSSMTIDSGNIRFMWKGNPRECPYKPYIQGFRTLGLRHLRKWGQHYYIALFNPLSLFHWPQNTWPWMTLNGLNGHFALKILRIDFEVYYLLTDCRVCLYTRDQRRCGKRSSGPWSGEYLESAKNCGSFIDSTSSEP